MLTAFQSNRLIGALLMVSGCCIGAGMLGLPLMTATAGLFPTLGAFVISWLFMAATGLLLLEANLWFGEGVNLMTLTERILGRGARLPVALLFVFLFYCLLVAYLVGGGALIAESFERFLGLHLSPYAGSIGLVIVFGVTLLLGTHQVDLFNRVLMVGLAVSFVALIALGIPHVQIEHLRNANWGYAVPALPAMIISFGYHNLVPSLTTYLKGNLRQLRIAIIAGSAIPLFIYLMWEGVILGILPQGQSLEASIDSGAMVTTLLRDAVGSSYVVDLLQAFAFFALVTSFLTVSLSFVDFLADGLHVKKTARGTTALVSLVLIPPLILSFLYPAIFLSALNYAGAFGAVILFGIIPVLMVWKGRYRDHMSGQRLVPGGKGILLLIGAFGLFVFLMQLKNELGV